VVTVANRPVAEVKVITVTASPGFGMYPYSRRWRFFRGVQAVQPRSSPHNPIASLGRQLRIDYFSTFRSDRRLPADEEPRPGKREEAGQEQNRQKREF
jgi:hypothetical protein